MIKTPFTPQYFAEKFDNIEKKINPIFEGFVDKIKKFYKKTLSKIHYDLYEEIKNHKFKDGKVKPHIAARNWFRTYAKETENQYRSKPLKQGHLYMYRYKFPKFMDTLDYWDTEPLMLSLGNFKTKDGELREVGINLHLLPLRVRILVLYEITNRILKSKYKKGLYSETDKVIPLKWEDIKKPLHRFGIGFAVRMYIPELRQETVRFKVEDYPSAIYLTSQKFEKVTQEDLEKRWRDYVKKHKLDNVKNESFI